MVHLFRAEVQRANVWRQRSDTTTNWAVVVTGAALSVSFSQPNVHHGVIILNTLLVTWFLLLRLAGTVTMSFGVTASASWKQIFMRPCLCRRFILHQNGRSLAENLLAPRFPISMWEAFGRRLRRNYLWIYLILGISWCGKFFFFLHPTSLSEFMQRAAVGLIPGYFMIGMGLYIIYSSC